MLLLAPKSVGSTWDLFQDSGVGPDAACIDASLEKVFARVWLLCCVPPHVARACRKLVGGSLLPLLHASILSTLGKGPACLLSDAPGPPYLWCSSQCA